jgi:tetratricopeptide (TPR) repeat protein
MKFKILFCALFIANLAASGQTFTMGKKCREKNTAASSLLKEKQYQQALDGFSAMEKSCTTKDAKEATANGKAKALNGLGRYDDAIKASDAALKVTNNNSLMAYFQKAAAQIKLKQYDAANASFSQMIALTEKNQDKKARASNYALISQLHWRYLENKDSANYFLDKAIALDPSNANFIVQKGDFLMDEKKYDEAFVQYDKAVSMGKTDLEMYDIRASARIRMAQDKYNTTNTQELRSKMTPKETEQICTELKKAIALGLKDMKMDMFSSLVCKQ